MDHYNIEIACDCAEAEQFVEWLNDKGHDAKVGRSTGTYIDGARTSSSDEANEISNSLWIQYCNS